MISTALLVAGATRSPGRRRDVWTDAFGIQAHTEILVDAQRRREQHARRKPWDADEVDETVSRVDAAWMAAGRLAYALIRAPTLGLRAAFRRRERVAPEQAAEQRPIEA